MTRKRYTEEQIIGILKELSPPVETSPVLAGYDFPIGIGAVSSTLFS